MEASREDEQWHLWPPGGLKKHGGAEPDMIAVK